MKINPYLIFNGDCKAAFTHYEKVLGGKIMFALTYGESPMADKMPAEDRAKIMHIRLEIGSNVLMGGDAPSGRYEAPKASHVAIGVDDPKEAERIFNALSEKAAICMPMQETFWAHRFGMLTDRFGTPWMINCERAAGGK